MLQQEYQEKDVEAQDVMKLTLKYLELDKIFVMVKTYTGKTHETRLCVWEFWHEISEESTITTRLARLRDIERHGCQRDLDFKSTVTTVPKRRWKFYQSIWMTYAIPVIQLHKKYCNENSSHIVSIGMFLNLCPF